VRRWTDKIGVEKVEDFIDVLPVAREPHRPARATHQARTDPKVERRRQNTRAEGIRVDRDYMDRS
jgi:spore cortex formation protein SpoVR/YcgB (stage V sporulation)